MSLINQMLKDLEKRSPSQGAPASGLPPRVASSGRSRRSRKLLWFGLALMLLAGGAGAWAIRIAAEPEKVEKPASEAIASATPSEVEPVSQVLPLADSARSSASSVEPQVALEGVSLTPREDGLQIEIAFSRVPTYRLIRGMKDRQLVLELPHGEITAEMPDVNGVPLLDDLQADTGPTGGRLVFLLKKACRYEALSLSDGPAGGSLILGFILHPETTPVQQPALPVASDDQGEGVEGEHAGPAESQPGAVSMPVAQAAPAEPEFVRQAAPLTPHQRAANLCRDGIAALQQGRLQEAEISLRTALSIEPGHIVARDMLLRLLTMQGRQTEIAAVLAEGTKALPEHLAYRERYARLLIERGALSEAREELLREPRPAVTDAPGMYAMLAALYQRQEQYAAAALTYRGLLAVEPQKALWWMGLGIALERTSSVEEARQAYRQALSRGGLSAGLQDYIRQRLAVLDNSGGQVPAVAGQAGKEKS